MLGIVVRVPDLSAGGLRFKSWMGSAKSFFSGMCAGCLRFKSRLGNAEFGPEAKKFKFVDDSKVK